MILVLRASTPILKRVESFELSQSQIPVDTCVNTCGMLITNSPQVSTIWIMLHSVFWLKAVCLLCSLCSARFARHSLHTNSLNKRRTFRINFRKVSEQNNRILASFGRFLCVIRYLSRIVLRWFYSGELNF